MNWMKVTGFESNYQVSEAGDIKNVHGKIKTPYGTQGYLYMTLSKDGERSEHKISRIVAKAFIPNPYNLPVVNHLDGIKHNNHFTNLEWTTQKENIRHAWETGLSSHSSRRVVTLYENEALIFDSAKVAGEVLDIHVDIVRRHSAKGSSYKGYTFYYEK